MNRRLFIFSLLSLFIYGCSSIDSSKRAMGNFDYAKITERKALQVPKSLDKPIIANDYSIPQNINHNGPVGERMDIRAPALVLPIAAASRVELNSSEPTVWFDQVLEDRNLTTFITQAVKEQVLKDGVEFKAIKAKKHLYQSSWYTKSREAGFLFWTYQDVLYRMRFQFKIQTKPHGRSVAVTVKLINYEDANGFTNMNVIDKQRAEVNMLNKIIAHVDYLYRQYQRDNRLMRATQKIVKVGENSLHEPAYIVGLEKTYLWDNLPSFFEKYGFKITDLNETKNIYYVTFKQPHNNFWASIWGDDVPVIDIPNAKYQFNLTSQGKKTALTIYNKKGKALSVDTLKHIYSVMEPGLSFRNNN